MRYEPALQLSGSAFSKAVERFLDPGCDSAHAPKLGRPVLVDEIKAVWRLIGIARVINIEFEHTPVGIDVVYDGRVDVVAQHARARYMRRHTDYGVGRRQTGRGYIDRIAKWRCGNRRMLGLRLIEKRQRTAAAPSDQYHPFVFPHFFGVPDIRPKDRKSTRLNSSQ